MEKLKAVICGCTKNSANYIHNEINNLLKLKSLFLSLDVVIYENDSTDNTVNLLKSLQMEKKITLISELGIQPKLKHRTMIIAHGRNKLVEYVNSQNKYDYMIMVDLDNIMNDFNKEGLVNAFSNDLRTWDVLTGNCSKIYYDIWALRFNRSSWSKVHNTIWTTCLDYDCWDMINHRKQMGFNERLLHIKTYQKHIPKDSELISVDSAFGGIGIYKVSKIKNCKYVGFTRKCSCAKYNMKGPCCWQMCEHVSFHKDMIEKHNAKIFICPRLIINGPVEHIV